MRSNLASWSAALLIACSGSDFTSGSDGVGSGGTNGSSDAGGVSSGAGGRAGGAGEASGGAAAGGRGSGGHRTGGAGTPSTGGSVASGGTTSGGGVTMVGGSGGGVVAVDAGPPVITGCGDAPPNLAAPCEGTFLCTYGNDPRPSCRVSYQCLTPTFTRTTPGCLPLKSCLTDVTPLPVIGNACSSQGDFCMYDSGLACSCTVCTGSGCAAINTWNCAPAATTPCPTTAPNIGEACDPSGPSDCKYGACGVASQVITHCKNGAWTWEFPSCN